MTDIYLTYLYLKATDEGIIENLEHYADCATWGRHNLCKDCPAYQACNELTSTGKTFNTNFDIHIRPNLHLTLADIKTLHPEYLI